MKNKMIIKLITAAVMLAAVVALTASCGTDRYEQLDKDGYTVSVTFDPNGGTMVGQTTYGINVGDYYSDIFGSMPQATRSGYTLSSWYNEKYGYTLKLSDYFAVEENVTFEIYDNASGDEWQWVKGPWPWEREAN